MCARFTPSQRKPRARPAAPNSAMDGQRRRGLARSTKRASAGSAKSAVSFVPSASARARPASASSVRDLPDAKYAQMINSEPTTRSLSAVGVCSATTVKVEKASAPNTPARRLRPSRRATPTIARHAERTARSCTIVTNRSPSLRIIEAIVSISAFGGKALMRSSGASATYADRRAAASRGRLVEGGTAVRPRRPAERSTHSRGGTHGEHREGGEDADDSVAHDRPRDAGRVSRPRRTRVPQSGPDDDAAANQRGRRRAMVRGRARDPRGATTATISADARR